MPELVKLMRSVLNGNSAAEVAQETAGRLYGSHLSTSARDPVVACYIDQNFQSLLHFLAKYPDFRECLLANTNAGGENVHRGLVLGAIMGAQVGASRISAELKQGLMHADDLEREISAFVAARIGGPDG